MEKTMFKNSILHNSLNFFIKFYYGLIRLKVVKFSLVKFNKKFLQTMSVVGLKFFYRAGENHKKKYIIKN